MLLSNLLHTQSLRFTEPCNCKSGEPRDRSRVTTRWLYIGTKGGETTVARGTDIHVRTATYCREVTLDRRIWKR